MDTLNLETLNWSILDDFDHEMRDWAGETDPYISQADAVGLENSWGADVSLANDTYDNLEEV